MLMMDQPMSLDHNKAAASLNINTLTPFVLKYNGNQKTVEQEVEIKACNAEVHLILLNQQLSEMGLFTLHLC